MIYKEDCPEINTGISTTLPASAKILSVGLDPFGKPCFWYLFDPEDKDEVDWNIFNVGTGFKHGKGLENFQFVGTVSFNGLVHHIFAKRLTPARQVNLLAED